MVAAGADDEVRQADASPTARKALGFEELLAGDVEAMKTRTRRYAKRQLTWMRKLPGVRTLDVTGRDPAGRGGRAARHDRAMKFEKWQALGNDYLIVEAAGVDPDEVRALCDRHLGVGADGVLALAPADEPGYVARLRIYNPDGSEAELSGNGARQALLYLREHEWTTSDTYSIQTVAGEIRTTITGERTCRVDMGRAIVRFDGEVAGQRFTHLTIGNPQTPIRVASVAELQQLDLATLGPLIEHHEAFPNRTNVSFWTELAPDRIRARIFERGVGETMSSGTGASGAAVAHVLRGGDSPVTVVLDGGELEVDIDESLHVDLTGWAVPVFRGELV